MRKFTCVLVGIAIIASVLTGCGNKNNTVVDNEENTQINQKQDTNASKEEKQTNQGEDILDNQQKTFVGYTAQIPKGYVFTGNAGKIIFKSDDKTDVYIARTMEDKATLSVSNVTSEKIAEYISKYLWSDDGISKHINGYTKDIPVSITSVNDVEINGMKMKKFEGSLTLVKSSSDKDNKWDCYVYGYIFETNTKTVGFFGLEQEQSQPKDKIELIKKNMDVMIKTVKLI